MSLVRRGGYCLATGALPVMGGGVVLAPASRLMAKACFVNLWWAAKLLPLITGPRAKITESGRPRPVCQTEAIPILWLS